MNHAPNTQKNENVVGSYGRGSENFGHLTTYDFLETTPEAAPETLSHELIHSVTPFSRENARFYGGELERIEAAEHAIAVADQTLETGVHLNGYHKLLADKLANEEISRGVFLEETNAIMGEMALTDRNGLALMQEAQMNKLEDANRVRRINGQDEIAFTSLTSTPDSEGDAELAGADKALARLIDGVETHEDLVLHTDGMKAKSYSVENYRKAIERSSMQQQNGSPYRTVVIESIAFIIDQRSRSLEDDEFALAA